VSRGHSTSRSGTVLIIVAGISALLMSVTVAYLVNMRSDLEESEAVIREAQARLVLVAALQYIQESSRMGWDRPGTPEHEEAFGWSDVRDGSAGPKDRTGTPLYSVGSGEFPDIGGRAGRFPLHALELPPYAVKPTFAYNPSRMDATLAWSALVNYTNPDPQPATTTWQDFKDGKPVPRQNSFGKSWFRIYRDRNTGTGTPVEPATFTITCGAGGTHGFRTYLEAANAGQGQLFNNDPATFGLLRSQERLLWFRTEWTSAVGGSSMGIRLANGYWELPEINSGSYSSFYSDGRYSGTPLHNADQHWWVNRNPVGSFLYIQRLDHEPAEW
jgi:hypothetical protein